MIDNIIGFSLIALFIVTCYRCYRDNR